MQRIGIVRGIIFAEQQTAGMTGVLYDSYTDLVEALRRDEIEEMEGILETLFLYIVNFTDAEW